MYLYVQHRAIHYRTQIYSFTIDRQMVWRGRDPKRLTQFYELGSDEHVTKFGNAWQSLVTIGGETSEIMWR